MPRQHGYVEDLIATLEATGMEYTRYAHFR
jgi:hypothetical protein